MPGTISRDACRRALSQRDLTEPGQGPHAIQLLVAAAVGALTASWRCAVVVHRGERVVTVADNYGLLGYPPGAVTREARYTRYVGAHQMLRSHASALVPGGLRRIAGLGCGDVLLACPGIVYRRDAIDRLHTGEPHQLDLWRVREGALGASDLGEMIETVVHALVPGGEVRLAEAIHPYTSEGREIQVRSNRDWVEIGECGVADPAVPARCGIDVPRHSGLAMGLGLDRILMVRKGIDDIRLLRSDDPRVAVQLVDLTPYRPVSPMPAVRRDLSLCVDAGTTEEEVGDRVRDALGRDAAWVESVAVLSRTPVELLPAAPRSRLGAVDGQENWLLRVTLRALDRSLTDAEANALRDRIAVAVHRGTVPQLIERGRG